MNENERGIEGEKDKVTERVASECGVASLWRLTYRLV